MFNDLLVTQKAAVTVVIFIGTFFGALTIGRLLKRKAGVRLGLLFQLFCLTLAFYAALSFYGVTASWRNHAGAAAFLLSAAFVVALPIATFGRATSKKRGARRSRNFSGSSWRSSFGSSRSCSF